MVLNLMQRKCVEPFDLVLAGDKELKSKLGTNTQSRASFKVGFSRNN
tara:strand:- start:1320 stop:1460 length:141 start_codon:yes stop_codon:yes gene_type:complete